MELRVPIIAAPMAGGPSTPALVRALHAAGGLGFLPGGYLEVRHLDVALRGLGDAPHGVNLLVPGERGDAEVVEAYRRRLQDAGLAPLGEPRWDDDAYAEKLALLAQRAPAAVSFAFGCPTAGDVARLQRAGSEVWVTVTTRAEADAAVARGVDAVIAQGVEAGGHRATWTNGDDDGLTLLVLLQQLEGLEVPVVATGGVMTGRGIAAARAAGAWAVQLGTAFLCTPEAGTSDVHRAAVGTGRPTRTTRAYTGRRARGVVTPFMDAHDDAAPSAYPELHHLTAPLRRTQDPDTVHLWAGQAHALARDGMPADELVAQLWREATRG